LWYWNRVFSGNLGPTRVGNENDWVALTSGNGQVLALRGDGTVWRHQWGSGNVNLTLNQVIAERNWVCILAGVGNLIYAIAIDGTLWISERAAVVGPMTKVITTTDKDWTHIESVTPL
jgi:hypothetical protein